MLVIKYVLKELKISFFHVLTQSKRAVKTFETSDK